MDTNQHQSPAEDHADQATAVSSQAKRRRSAASAITLLPKLIETFLWNQRGPALAVAATIAEHIARLQNG